MTKFETAFNKLKYGDKSTWTIFGLLFVLSLLEVFSASSALAYEKENFYSPILGHLRLMGMSLGALVVAHIIPLSWVRHHCRTFTLLSFAALLALLLFGKDVNGSARWFSIYGFTVQPSEFTKLGIIVSSAFYIAQGQETEGLSWKALKSVLIFTGIACALIVSENLSTALLLFSAVMLMLVVGRIRWKHLGGIVAAVAAAGAIAVIVLVSTPAKTLDSVPFFGRRASTWKSRIETKFTRGEKVEVPPHLYNLQDEPQRADSNIAIARGNIFLPKGVGRSVQRDHLSYAYSDFIYSIIVEEWGWFFGCVGLMFLYFCILSRAIILAKKCESPFHSHLILGVSLMIIMQAFIHMAVGADVIPITGQPLPLISKGGSSMVVNCIYIGLILNVSATMKQSNESEIDSTQQPAESQQPTAASLTS